MKYIKTFEDLNDTEYVLCQYNLDDKYAYHVKLTPELITFINNSIGTLQIESNEPNIWISVEYEDIPNELKHKFMLDNTIMLTKDVIVARSTNKKELEAILAANKYNL